MRNSRHRINLGHVSGRPLFTSSRFSRQENSSRHMSDRLRRVLTSLMIIRLIALPDDSWDAWIASSATRIPRVSVPGRRSMNRSRSGGRSLLDGARSFSATRFSHFRWAKTSCLRRQISGSLLKIEKKRRECYAERFGDLGDVQETQIALAALDCAHEGAVHATVIREGLLGKSLLGPQLANALSQSLEQPFVKRIIHSPECSRVDALTSTEFT
jgi:hypothetical protein